MRENAAQENDHSNSQSEGDEKRRPWKRGPQDLSHICIYTSGKAWQIEADKSCNDSKPLQDHMRHVVQQSHVRKTNVYTAAIQRTKFKNPASLMRIQKNNVVRRSY